MIVTVADLHASSKLGLPPGLDFELDDGDTYGPTVGQVWLWEAWHRFWDDIERLTKKWRPQKKIVVYVGDVVDDNSHPTLQLISRNRTTIVRIGVAATKRSQAWADESFVVRGTEAHGGLSGSLEEAFAESVGAYQDGHNWSWWHLPLVAGGVRFDICHEGPLGQLAWTIPNAAGRLASEIVLDHAEDSSLLPHVVVRAHRHKRADTGDNFIVRVRYLPPWQLRVARGQRFAAGRLEKVGGDAYLCQDGRYVVEPFEYRAPRRDWCQV